MSVWQQHSIEARIIAILQEVPEDREHHFGRPFLTAYQITLAFAQRHPDAVTAIGEPIGGAGIGQRSSLAQYLARELSQRIARGQLPQVEGAFLSNHYLDDVTFTSGGDVIRSSLTESQYPLSMFRIRPSTGAA
jgi:hypothetical protein